jgi:hypothetical protein
VEHTPRQSWITPQVQRYGTFEQKTQACDKQYGGTDGYTFMGQSIVCAS